MLEGEKGRVICTVDTEHFLPANGANSSPRLTIATGVLVETTDRSIKG